MSRRPMNRFLLFLSFFLVIFGQSDAQWQQTTFPAAAVVHTIAIHDSTLFAGTNGQGIFVSTDNGRQWKSANDGLQNNFVHTIFINGTTVFAGTDAGASRSTNNGATWTDINSGLSGKGVWSFASRDSIPGDSTIFAGTWSGVYLSNNNGTIWNATGLFTTTMPVHSIIKHQNYIYAATEGGGVFYSETNGAVWKDISVVIPGDDPEMLPVHSLARLDTIVVASAGDGILYFTSYRDPRFIRYGIGGSQRISSFAILSFSVRRNQLFTGDTYGEIFKGNFNGQNWTTTWDRLAGHAIYSLALNNSYMFAGTESGVWRLWYPEASTKVDDSNNAPAQWTLEQNYPNPFNSSTKIQFSIPSAGRVSLKVYTMLGSVVMDLVDKTMSPGTYRIEFSPATLPSGIYFYTLATNEFRMTRKLILMK